ncbi:hypothetical protein [Lentibacter sp. XHP0401]|jgi:hypothetical protein|uniref:hypothetical protein n=1 Tax=Lentibacter sp. XHP0401 TaxID=2984334 RepID=UPI0021E7F2C5|nr:hypothetical protein [Lentibacter sp. XHP0401]MCV2894468.1 hypothetical protein [Lentibacter sp. XHP0401]
MRKSVLACGLVAMTLSGCMAVEGTSSAGLLTTVPEEVLAIAGPNQNLAAIRVNPVDGCFEYQHVGPVETTFLPLRTAKGNPICTKPAAT